MTMRGEDSDQGSVFSYIRMSAELGTSWPEAGHGHATTVRRAPHAA